MSQFFIGFASGIAPLLIIVYMMYAKKKSRSDKQNKENRLPENQ